MHPSFFMMKYHPLHTDIERPARFTYPFCYEPHPLCLLAAQEVQQELGRMTLTEGKMFGVLVVADCNDELGFVAAYSGLLEGRNDWPYFVPPVYDAQLPDGHFKQEERLISAMRDDSQKEERRQRSQQLQLWLFDQYRFLNAHPPQISATTRRHWRLLCPEAAAVCLPRRAEAVVYGRVLVGTVAED